MCAKSDRPWPVAVAAYFDTPVLSGRTRSQGIKGPKEGAAATPGAAPTALTSGGSQAAAGVSMSTNKEDGGESAGSGLKRSKRSLRMKGKCRGSVSMWE